MAMGMPMGSTVPRFGAARPLPLAASLEAILSVGEQVSLLVAVTVLVQDLTSKLTPVQECLEEVVKAEVASLVGGLAPPARRAFAASC